MITYFLLEVEELTYFKMHLAKVAHLNTHIYIMHNHMHIRDLIKQLHIRTICTVGLKKKKIMALLI